MKDKVQELQRRKQIMPKYAPDQDEPLQEQVTWEEMVNQPVAPRRSSWRTPGIDDFDLLAQVSEQKNPITALSIPLSQQTMTTGVSEEQVLAIVTSPSVIATITQAVIAALPIVDFKCPN